MAKEQFILTDAHKSYLMLHWDKEFDIIEAIRHISGDPKADLRHRSGRAIKDFLIANGKTVKTSKYEAKGNPELTPEQKEFCENNAGKMKPLEIAKSLFGNDKLTTLHGEARAVFDYIAEIAPNVIETNDKPPRKAEYDAPKTVYELIDVVNRYVFNSKKENEGLYDRSKLTSQDERNLRALLGYMNIPRFVYQMNQYDKHIERELYESTFIGMTHDKPDLLREEIDQYISLAAEIVTSTQIDRHIQTLDREVESSFSGNNKENKRLSMTMVEFINSARATQDKSKERQKKLIGELIGSRAKRQEGKIVANATVLNLVEAWQDEKIRRAYIKMAMEQKAEEANEVDKLIDMESVVAMIAGVTRDELIN